jgi:hypothetical protein
LPSRGMDLLAVEPTEELALLLSESKASEDPASPPTVVGEGDSSLRAQLLAFLADRPKVLRELNWVLKHSREDQQSAVARALLLFTRGHITLRVVPVLLRPSEQHGANDYGVFLDQPDEFAPASIRFCLLRIEGSFESLAEAVYRGARQER